MDLQVALISLGVIVVSAAVVYLISILGTKETSYEEAVAEQRRKGEELIGELARLDRAGGSRERKGHANKKWGRKSKEKVVGEATDHQTSGGHLHVDFKVEAEIIPDDDDEDETVVPVLHASKNRRHSDEPRSILVTKRITPTVPLKVAPLVKPVVVKVKEPTPPKTIPVKVEVKKEQPEARAPTSSKTPSRESSKEKELVEPKKASAKVEPLKRESESKTPSRESSKEKEIVAKTAAVSSSNNKTNAKPKPEAVMTSGRLSTLIKSTSLTNEDVQTLVEVLLNKRQSESESSWLKAGQKVDPVAALRKQLDEREAALTEETQRAVTLGGKLKEAKAELLTEKSRATQLERLAKEGQQELQVARKRGDQAVQEAKAFQVKIQELKGKTGEENVTIRKLQEDNKSLKKSTAQLESKFTGVNRENETLRQSACDLTAQLTGLQQALEQQHHSSEATIMQLQEQLQALSLAKVEGESWKQPLEDLSNQVQVLEKEKASILHELRALTDAEAQLRSENVSVVQRVNQLHEDFNAVDQAKRQLEVSVEELRQNLNNSENHTGILQSQIAELNTKLVKMQDENISLREENEFLSSQVSSLSERQEAEGQEGSGDASPSDKTNGHIQVVEDAGVLTKIELAEHENILHEKDKLVDQLTSALREKESVALELGEQVEQYKREVTALTADIEGQKTKNNELREKNWKAMEALKSAEKMAKERIEQVEKLQNDTQNERLNEMQKNEQNRSKAVLERIFPAIRINKMLTYPQWTAEFEREAAQCLAELSAHSNNSATNGAAAAEGTAQLERKLVASDELCAKLQADIQLYKTVLAQTEAMLNKLQSSVEEEELRWKEKLELKEKQLEQYHEEKKSLEASLVQIRAAEEAASEMQDKLRELQDKLQVEENERRSLEEHRTELEAAMARLQSQLAQSENQLQQWKLERESIGEHAKELEIVKEELAKEKQNTKTLTTQNVKLNSLVKIGQDSLKAEMQTVGSLEGELKALKDKQAQVVTTNGSSPDSPPATEAQLKAETGKATTSRLSRSPASSLSSLLHRASQPSLDNSSPADTTAPKSKSKKRVALGKK